MEQYYAADSSSGQQSHNDLPTGAQLLGGQQYVKMDLRSQIRLRPDTYIGSSTGVSSDQQWISKIVGEGNIKTEFVSMQICSAIIGISKEVFDNATDNVERSRIEKIDPGIIEVVCTENCLTVKNYGKHIPVVIHHTEKVWVPHMIFGILLTSDNYDDSISRYKIGRNGYGIKLGNIFSVWFQITVADPVNKLLYVETWTNGMLNTSPPSITPYEGPGFTQVSLVPDFKYFYENNGNEAFLPSMQSFYLSRTMEMSFACKIPTFYNGISLNFVDAVKYFNSHFDSIDPNRKQLHWESQDGKQEFVVADTPGNGFVHAFVNGTPVHQGEHVNEYLKAIFEEIITKYKNEHNKSVTVVHLKKHVSLLLRVTLDKPSFDSQIKKKLTKPKNIKIALTSKMKKEVLKWELDEELRKAFNMKSKQPKEHKLKFERVAKVIDAAQANSSDPLERRKCTLIITEGDTGKTLATKGNKYLPGGMKYNGVFPIRGKTANLNRHGDDYVDKNKELSSILTVLNADRNIDYFKNPKEYDKLRYGKVAFMCDADYDAYHIQGLLMYFFYTELKDIAQFEFIIVIMTPVIEAFKGGQRLAFYYQKQFNKWCQENDKKGWDFKYKKGLGSWNTDSNTLKLLFEHPIIVTMQVDPTTDDMLKLAFDKKLAQQRKEWISGFDPNSLPPLRTPRPVTEFFENEFRDYSNASVIRAIPRLMDGMKPVHRKILYSLLKKFPKGKKVKKIKIPQFGGFVMEKAGYHHGEEALYKTIIGMGQRYITGPNNIPLVDIEGNPGDRLERGADQSPARYLWCGLDPIARYIYRPEDEPIWEILYDDGNPVEPKEMFPVIAMCLVNKCEGIATGWSTKIPCHDPRVVLQWTKEWVTEKKSKRDIPKDSLVMDVSSKPDLIPWWRDYRGVLIRIKNTPHEVYRNEGIFQVHFHTIFVTELPAEVSIENYRRWGEAEADKFLTTPDEAKFRSFQMMSAPPVIDFRIAGISNPTVENLNLVRSINLSNMTLIDKDSIPKKFSYTYEIMCEWCDNRLDIYEKRRLYSVSDTEKKLKLTNLKYMFIMDVIEERLILRGRSDEEIIPYMKAKGYPYGEKKNRKKKKSIKDDDEDQSSSIESKDFLAIPLRSITKRKAEKLKNDVINLQKELDYYINVLPEDLWLKDLGELEIQLAKLYQTSLY